MSAILLIKRNDKQTAIGNEWAGVKHGDPVDLIDDSDPIWKGKTAEEIISGRGNHEAFLPVQIDESKIKLFKGLLASTHDIADKTLDTSIYRPRIKRIDIEVLASLCGIRDLDKRMHSGDSLSIVNGTELTEEHFKDATTISNDIRFTDVKHISIGAATVGAAGKYATLVLAYADLTNLTGDLTFTIISAISSLSEAGITEDLGGFTFRTTSSVTLLADPTRTTNLISCAHNSRVIYYKATGNGKIICDNLYFKRTVAGFAVSAALLWSSHASAGIVCDYRDCIYNGNSLQGCAIRIDNSMSVLYIYNNTAFCGEHGIIIDATDGNANSIYSNNNFYSFVGSGFLLAANPGTLKNNAVFSGGVNYSNINGATGINNYSDDATNADGNWAAGAGNKINQVALSGWQSVTNTDANFLDIIAGGIFDGAGVANDAALARTLCGRGRQVPGPNGTSVGVAERITPTPSTGSHTAISNTIAIM